MVSCPINGVCLLTAQVMAEDLFLSERERVIGSWEPRHR